MSPDEAVEHLAQVLGGRPTLDLAEGCQALESRGTPRALAVRTYLFTQVAWARAFLDGMGIQFSPDYALFDKAGEIVETGKLDEEPSYRAARKTADKVRETPGFKNLVFTAAEFKAVNSALISGSKTENLVLSAAFIALETLTPEGASKMNAVLQKPGESIKGDAASRKAWWRFW